MAHEQLILLGTMCTHTDWVTSIATPVDNSDMIVSCSIPNSMDSISPRTTTTTYGVAERRLTGHSHFVQDVVLSSCGEFALSGETVRRLAGHTKFNYCTCLSWSADGSTLFSGYPDGVIQVWGIKATENHT